MTKLNKKLLILAASTLVLCIISYLPFVRQKSAPKAFQSALLNPSHKDEVTEIVIEKNGNGTDAADFSDVSDRMNEANTMNSAQKIVLRKAFDDAQKAVWTVSDGLTTVRAEKKLIENLFTNMTKLRKMYIISDNKKSWQLPRQSSVSISFKNNDKMYAKLDFFTTNSLTNRIIFTVESQKNVYETDDTVSQFLQTTVSYWARPELIQSIEEPISFVFQENGKNPVKILAFSPEFEKKSHDVMILRHGTILLPNDSQSPAATLTVHAEDGAYEIISFYPLPDGAFRCEYQFRSPEKSVSTLSALSCAFEISGWTYDRLRTIFTNE